MVSFTEATCPGANSFCLPQLLMYKIELSRNTNRDRLRPASTIQTPKNVADTPANARKQVAASTGTATATAIAINIATSPISHTSMPTPVTIFCSRSTARGC